jgi:hypothetical protein
LLACVVPSFKNFHGRQILISYLKMQEREINDIRMFNGTASLDGYFSPFLKVLFSETDLWLKVGSFDRSSLKSEAQRVFKNIGLSPILPESFKVLSASFLIAYFYLKTIVDGAIALRNLKETNVYVFS